MQGTKPGLTTTLSDINAVLRAHQYPLLMLQERAYGTGTHYSVVEEGRLGRTLCPPRNPRECGIWLEGFLAARLHEVPAAPKDEKAEAYY